MAATTTGGMCIAYMAFGWHMHRMHIICAGATLGLPLLRAGDAHAGPPPSRRPRLARRGPHPGKSYGRLAQCGVAEVGVAVLARLTRIVEGGVEAALLRRVLTRRLNDAFTNAFTEQGDVAEVGVAALTRCVLTRLLAERWPRHVSSLGHPQDKGIGIRVYSELTASVTPPSNFCQPLSLYWGLRSPPLPVPPASMPLRTLTSMLQFPAACEIIRFGLLCFDSVT